MKTPKGPVDSLMPLPVSESSSPPPKASLLLVDPDTTLATALSSYLNWHGMEVTRAADGDQALRELATSPPEVVLLEVQLSGASDGLDVCRRMRASFDGPILFFSSRGSEVDQVVGLEVGADDYIVKPASPRLVLARIKALRRWIDRLGASVMVDPHSRVIGDLEVSQSTRVVRREGAEVELSTAEFDLLWALADKPGTIRSRDDLMQAVRGIGYNGQDRSVDVGISKLRSKLGDGAPPHRLIKTVRGVGYLLSASPS